jgi:hypothetical protein
MSAQYRPALQNMESYSFPVLFSEGAQTKAKDVATRCERVHRYFKGVLEFNPTFRLLVLSPRDWETHADFPVYGNAAHL